MASNGFEFDGCSLFLEATRLLPASRGRGFAVANDQF
jgi:hypothetical protein